MPYPWHAAKSRNQTGTTTIHVWDKDNSKRLGVRSEKEWFDWICSMKLSLAPTAPLAYTMSPPPHTKKKTQVMKPLSWETGKEFTHGRWVEKDLIFDGSPTKTWAGRRSNTSSSYSRSLRVKRKRPNHFIWFQVSTRWTYDLANLQHSGSTEVRKTSTIFVLLLSC